MPDGDVGDMTEHAAAALAIDGWAPVWRVRRRNLQSGAYVGTRETSRSCSLRQGFTSALKLFWWGWGETDIARANGLAVIDKFKSHGVRIDRWETPGGHTWENWRLYLCEVGPKLLP